MVKERQPFHLTPYPQPVADHVLVRTRTPRSPPPPLVTWTEYTQRVVGEQPMHVEINYARPTETTRKVQSQPSSPRMPRAFLTSTGETKELPIGVTQNYHPPPLADGKAPTGKTAEYDVFHYNSGKYLRQRETDSQFCQVCNRMVDPSNKLALTDRVYHPECAKCQTCQIDLGKTAGKDFGGVLYCMPHYAQAVSDYMEFRRKHSGSLTRMSPTDEGVGFRRGAFRASWRQPSKNAWSVYDMHLDLPPEGYELPPERTSQEHVNMVGSAPPLAIEQETTYVPVMKEGGRAEAPQPRVHVHVEHPSQALGVCAVCNKSVFPTNYVPLSSHLYHFYCLQCHTCGRNLSPWSYRELDGRPYCSKDYTIAVNAQYAMKMAEEPRGLIRSDREFVDAKIPIDKTSCYTCGQKSFATETLYVMERVYHKRCFRCTACNGTLGVENYHVLDGQPYCRAHYRALLFARGIEPIKSTLYEHALELAEPDEKGSIVCQVCQYPVRPRDCINVLQQYYHYSCFKCAKCGQVLSLGKFEMMQGKPYCQDDFLALFGRTTGRSSRQSLTNLSDVRGRSPERSRSQQGRSIHCASVPYVR